MTIARARRTVQQALGLPRVRLTPAPPVSLKQGTTYALIVVALAAAGLAAQGPPPGGGRGPAAGQTVEKIRELKPSLYMITGSGANTLVRVTPEGVIVVDTKNPGDVNYTRVMVSDHITDGTPIVDFANGGSAVQWTRSLDGVLALDFELAIPGRGEPKSRADVQAFRDRFATLVSRAREAIKTGATRETLAMQVRTDDLTWTFQPAFWGGLFDELTK